jgi:nitrogen fixation-related uncharacterized protein
MEVILVPILDIIIYGVGYLSFFWLVKKIVKPLDPSY